MKLDLFYEIDAARPWDGPHPYGQRARERKAYRNALAQIRLADQLGFHCVWCVEHHFREGRSHMAASEVVLGALSQTTERIRLGFGVTLAPFGFIHPTRIAEKVATVDLLSEGRVEWGVGRSTPMEQTAFGVDREKSTAQMLEAVEIVSRMWRDEYFEWDSPDFQMPARMITPKPWQDPHPAPWMATATPSSARLAGENGLGLLSFAIMRPMEELAALYATYREGVAVAKPRTPVANQRIGAYTLVHAAESDAQAEANGVWDNVNWWYENLAEFTLKWELPHLSEEEKAVVFPFLDSVKEGQTPIAQYKEAPTLIIGDAARCIEKMKAYADLGVDQLLCYVAFGNMEHEAVVRSLEILGKEVIPELEAYEPAGS